MATPLLNDGTWLAVNKQSNFRNKNSFMVATIILQAAIMDFVHLELT